MPTSRRAARGPARRSAGTTPLGSESYRIAPSRPDSRCSLTDGQDERQPAGEPHREDEKAGGSRRLSPTLVTAEPFSPCFPTRLEEPGDRRSQAPRLLGGEDVLRV